MKNILIYSLLLIPLFSIANSLHGDIYGRIIKVSKEIKKHLDIVNLYFKRVKLYFQNEEYKKSLKDLQKPSKLEALSIEYVFQYADTFLKLKEYNSSIAYLKQFLSNHSKIYINKLPKESRTPHILRS